MHQQKASQGSPRQNQQGPVPKTILENRRISARLRSMRTPETFPAPPQTEYTNAAGARPPAFNLPPWRAPVRRDALTAGKGSAQSQFAQRVRESDLNVRLAKNAAEHFAAFNLAYEQYLAFGYVTPLSCRMRATPWNLLRTTHTFVAYRGEHMVGTLTCIEDGPDGLPAEALYPEEIRTFRAQRGKLIEVSAFAMDSGETHTFASLELIRAITTHSRLILNGTDWVITVNPRHVRFYQKVMLFEPLGGENSCSSVNGAPGVLLRLNLKTMPDAFAARYACRRGARDLHQFFFDPQGEQARLEQLTTAAEMRLKNWATIQQALETHLQFIGPTDTEQRRVGG